jgi:hypothetical protein
LYSLKDIWLQRGIEGSAYESKWEDFVLVASAHSYLPVDDQPQKLCRQRLHCHRRLARGDRDERLSCLLGKHRCKGDEVRSMSRPAMSRPARSYFMDKAGTRLSLAPKLLIQPFKGNSSAQGCELVYI